ncbi:DpnD/PcfM family protein [Psychrobacter sp. AOP7-A1-24]|uniref:DpnD/PcfM family protein n=1 Tax=Psychrobacter sp. AOP7-A1-24 TaxID=3457646 RepID=UPI00402B9ED4
MNIIERNEKSAQTFQIEIVETLSTTVEVVAEDEQSALLKAQEMYRNEQVVLYPDDFIDTKFVVFQ